MPIYSFLCEYGHETEVMCSYEESIKQEDTDCLKKMDCGGKLKRNYNMMFQSKCMDRDSVAARQHSGKNKPR